MTVHATDTASPLRWVDSTTTVQTRRWAAPPRHVVNPATTATHRADFAIAADNMLDLRAEFSSTVHFKPDFVRAKWVDGELINVTVSGPRRLTSGGLSPSQNRQISWDSYRTSLDKDQLPAVIAQGLADYEAQVAEAAVHGDSEADR